MYTYHARTNRVASTTDTGVDYRYNPSGNMTRSETAHDEGHVSLTYDYFLNRPARIIHPTWGLNQGTTDMAYNSSRQRVLKKTDEYGAINTTLYVHGLSAQPLSVTHCIDVTVRNECWLARYIWGPDGLIAELHSYLGNPSDERFVVKDHLGSIRLIVDADDGTVRAWQDYAPFGEVMRGADISAHLRYTYTGQEADTELGLMNYEARLYDPEIGIFLAADPAGQIAASYVYAGNNPISFVDPDGEWFIEALAISAAVIGAITRGYSAYQASGGDMIYTITSAVMGGVRGGMTTYVGITVGGGLEQSTHLKSFMTTTIAGGLRGAPYGFRSAMASALSAATGNVFQQTGVFGLVAGGTGWDDGFRFLAGRAISTTASSMVYNVARGEHATSRLNIGIGPATLVIRDGSIANPLRSFDNWAVLSMYALVGANTLLGGELDFDRSTMTPMAIDGPIVNFLVPRFGAAMSLFGVHAYMNRYVANDEVIFHEGVHSIQMGLQASMGTHGMSYLMNTLIGMILGYNMDTAYRMNYYEDTAYKYQGQFKYCGWLCR